MKESNAGVDVDKKKYLSVLKSGKWATLLIGVLYIAIAILLPMDPAERYRGDEFYRELSTHAFIPNLWRCIFVVIGFLTIVWITAAVKRVRKTSFEWEGLYQWVIILGYMGAAMNVIDWSREICGLKRMILWGLGDPMYRIAAEVSTPPIDADFFWKFGGLGLWYLVTCLLAKRAKIFDNKSNILGILVGIDLIFTMIFGITDSIIYFEGGQMALMQITALIGGILAAIYHIRMFFVIKNDMKELIE